MASIFRRLYDKFMIKSKNLDLLRRYGQASANNSMLVINMYHTNSPLAEVCREKSMLHGKNPNDFDSCRFEKNENGLYLVVKSKMPQGKFYEESDVYDRESLNQLKSNFVENKKQIFSAELLKWLKNIDPKYDLNINPIKTCFCLSYYLANIINDIKSGKISYKEDEKDRGQNGVYKFIPYYTNLIKALSNLSFIVSYFKGTKVLEDVIPVLSENYFKLYTSTYDPNYRGRKVTSIEGLEQIEDERLEQIEDERREDFVKEVNL